MQKFLSLLIQHEIRKIVLIVKLDKMNFIWPVNCVFNKGIILRPDSQQESPIVFRNDGNGRLLELLESFLLPFLDLYELCYINHSRQLIKHPGKILVTKL